MFWQIVSFDVRNRFRRPVIYLYFGLALVFTAGTFALGALPIADKEHINSPYLIAMWCAGITMIMMLVSSSIMGDALYRDIEYNTKDYYLTYPITRADYFWGRFTGSMICMLIIASAIPIGIFLGSKLGPLFGWHEKGEYGPNALRFYLQPFITIALPNILFSSTIFYGLVAITRNVKVIYSGGIFLFLAYFISNFLLNQTHNETLITIADPFGLNGIRYKATASNFAQKNGVPFPIDGNYLINRLVWPGLGILVLVWTYAKFNFADFFAGKKDRAAIDEAGGRTEREVYSKVQLDFGRRYKKDAFFSLTKLELTNIFRDNYFWIIFSSGVLFLGFVFWMGNREYNVPDFPTTAMLFSIFNDGFPFFIFFVIIFYTGETLHRDRSVRYAFINDSLPPPNWIMNGSKLLSLLVLGVVLSLMPVVIGLLVQTLKGFHDYNLKTYISQFFVVNLPRFLEMVLFCYLLHVLINSKFVAHAVGVICWVTVFFLRDSGTFDYNLMLYSYTPNFRVNDMDGMGHMLRPVAWFNLYWTLFGALLIVVAALFYYRGLASTFKERIRLVPGRFDRTTKIFTTLLALAFVAVAAFNYYNVDYLNEYLTKNDREERAIQFEKTLKKYQSLPIPKVTGMQMTMELYPDKQEVYATAVLHVVNKNAVPVSRLLLDGGDLNSYSLQQDGRALSYSAPLLYHRGFFDFFKTSMDTAEYRLYELAKPIAPGDSAIFNVSSATSATGFRNGLYFAGLLHNGTFLGAALPDMGYDEREELRTPRTRKKAGLPPRLEAEISQDDSMGIRTLRAGKNSDLMVTDLTIGTSPDQTVVAPGELVGQWKANGRNYFHYVSNKSGLYAPFSIISARFAAAKDTVQLDQPVNVSVLYHPAHDANVSHFMNACKDGLRFFNSAYGNYPFKDMRVVESSWYSRREATMTTLQSYAENFGWIADSSQLNQYDYCYFNTIRGISQQWWRFVTAPNNTVGSLVISEGLPTYDLLVMAEKKYGKNNIKSILQDQLWAYVFFRHRDANEHPLIKANLWYEWNGKAAIALYGLRDLIGEDSMNAALREFRDEFAFRSEPPFAGSRDLFRCLKNHVPDSLQYYLSDTWEKVCLYDNRLRKLLVTSTGKPDEYKVTLDVEVKKFMVDAKGNDVNVNQFNDYIDIGVFGAETVNAQGRREQHPLYLVKQKLSAGEHSITVIVRGKPVNAGIDPLGKLIDRNPGDNTIGL